MDVEAQRPNQAYIVALSRLSVSAGFRLCEGFGLRSEASAGRAGESEVGTPGQGTGPTTGAPGSGSWLPLVAIESASRALSKSPRSLEWPLESARVAPPKPSMPAPAVLSSVVKASTKMPDARFGKSLGPVVFMPAGKGHGESRHGDGRLHCVARAGLILWAPGPAPSTLTLFGQLVYLAGHMKYKKRYLVRLDEVILTREGETAIIQYKEKGVPTTHLGIGPKITEMTNEEIVELFNETLRAQASLAAEYKHVVVEMPLGSRQIQYHRRSAQWTARGTVLRCVIHDNEFGQTVIEIDDKELSLEEFGDLLRTYAGWGMRIELVSRDEIHRRPALEEREPKRR